MRLSHARTVHFLPKRRNSLQSTVVARINESPNSIQHCHFDELKIGHRRQFIADKHEHLP